MRMDRALTEAIRMERFEDLYVDVESGRLGCADAALILGCSVRHFLRLRVRYEDTGLEGLRDGRVGRVSRQRAADAEVEALTRLYRDRYSGFNIRHFHDAPDTVAGRACRDIRAGRDAPPQACTQADAGYDDPSGCEHALLVWR
jgi:hypothetical protein